MRKTREKKRTKAENKGARSKEVRKSKTQGRKQSSVMINIGKMDQLWRKVMMREKEEIEEGTNH